VPSSTFKTLNAALESLLEDDVVNSASFKGNLQIDQVYIGLASEMSKGQHKKIP